MSIKQLLTLGLAAGSALAATIGKRDPLNIRAITFNIRYAVSEDQLEPGELIWWDYDVCSYSLNEDKCRQPGVDAAIAAAAQATLDGGGVPIIGLQEVLNEQLIGIQGALGDGWSSFGYGRDDGAEAGEYSPIFYPNGLVELLYSEQKWLSPTPDVPSAGWGAPTNRIVTICVFKHTATGKQFLHANTHLDVDSLEARVEGIKVVMARMQAVAADWGGDALGVTLTGDFNSSPGSGDAYQTLADANYMTEVFDSPAARLGTNQLTYSGFDATGDSRIDYIWFGPNELAPYAATQYEITTNDVDGVFISDHRLMYADLTLA